MVRMLAIIGAVSCAGCTQGRGVDRYTVVDLTHTLDHDTIFWPTEKGFERTTKHAGVTPKGYYYAAGSFCSPEHGGTHVDAPVHFYDGGAAMDEIPLRRVMGPAVVVDVSAHCAADRDYQVVIDDLLAWERAHHDTLFDKIVLLNTGYGQFWPDRVQYMGTDERGPDAVAKLHFPGLHPDAALWLATARHIRAVGLDTPSIDYGQSTLFESHVRLFEHDIPAFENVANLGRLPARGFDVIALPMKIGGGSGGPVRMIALLD